MSPSATNGGSKGPFEGILVIDLSHVLAGPFCTMLLSDLGARVIKVERPGSGDDSRAFGPFLDNKSLYFGFINRGKQSIALNLKHDDDRTLFESMVRRADVVVENFRPGTMEHLGYTWEALSAMNPRLVYASASGYGQTGPKRTEPAYDTVIQGMSGLMSLTGFANGPATKAGTSIADITTGIYTFGAIVSALYAREKSGHGARVDIAMFDAVLSILEHGLMHYAATGKVPERLGNRHPTITPFDTFDAADKAFVICAGDNALFAALCTSVGRAELATDARFTDNDRRTENAVALRAELEAVLKTRPAAHWLPILDKAGIPCGSINDVASAVADPQVAARNMMITAGGVRMPGNPIKISGYDDPAERAAAPALDASGTAIRAEFASARSAK
jgi:CoA:oxalate CoA-transferase